MIDVLQKDVSIDRLIPCTDARGIVTTYAYNLYGDLVSQTYSDATPAVTYAYDALGRQTQATDAVGTTTFGYIVPAVKYRYERHTERACP